MLLSAHLMMPIILIDLNGHTDTSSNVLNPIRCISPSSRLGKWVLETYAQL